MISTFCHGCITGACWLWRSLGTCFVKSWGNFSFRSTWICIVCLNSSSMRICCPFREVFPFDTRSWHIWCTFLRLRRHELMCLLKWTSSCLIRTRSFFPHWPSPESRYSFRICLIVRPCSGFSAIIDAARTSIRRHEWYRFTRTSRSCCWKRLPPRWNYPVGVGMRCWLRWRTWQSPCRAWSVSLLFGRSFVKSWSFTDWLWFRTRTHCREWTLCPTKWLMNWGFLAWPIGRISYLCDRLMRHIALI